MKGFVKQQWEEWLQLNGRNFGMEGLLMTKCNMGGMGEKNLKELRMMPFIREKKEQVTMDI
jgi:hypothetical protein